MDKYTTIQIYFLWGRKNSYFCANKYAIMSQQNYDKLKELLAENKKWPLLYMFKFIVPNNEGKVQTVIDMLPKHGTVSFKHTKNLKYVSVTCKVSMKNAESIIELTDKVSSIEGVMAL